MPKSAARRTHEAVARVRMATLGGFGWGLYAGAVSDDSGDRLEQALGIRVPAVRKLRLLLIAVLMVVLVAKLLGWFDASWRFILWLTAAVAVLPPILVGLTIARNLERPTPKDVDDSDD